MTNHNPCLQEAHSLVDGAGLRRIKRNIIRPIHSCEYLLNTYYLYRKKVSYGIKKQGGVYDWNVYVSLYSGRSLQFWVEVLTRLD